MTAIPQAEHPDRRQDVPFEEERQGLVNRIESVSVGDEFGLYQGTEGILFDPQSGIDWGQMMQTLGILGVLERDDERPGIFVKRHPLAEAHTIMTAAAMRNDAVTLLSKLAQVGEKES